MTSIESKLLGCTPYSSFLSEQNAAKLFLRSGWESTHGLYYDDPLTNKQRELDVVARQIWKRKSQSGEQLGRITLLLEVKSMKGFHLLISEHPAESDDFFEHIHWLGDPTGKYVEVNQGLINLGRKPEEIGRLLKALHQHAYPRQTCRMWKMMVRPHPIATFTSFRETNLGSEKDLDNSVFWRASQNLRSAHASISGNIREVHLETLLGAAEFEAKNKDWMRSMLWWASQQIGMVDIIHPIVVTDAEIWVASGDRPSQRGFARFGTHTYTGRMDWWCDVVNSEYLEEYVDQLTQHYRKHMRSAKAQLRD